MGSGVSGSSSHTGAAIHASASIDCVVFSVIILAVLPRGASIGVQPQSLIGATHRCLRHSRLSERPAHTHQQLPVHVVQHLPSPDDCGAPYEYLSSEEGWFPAASLGTAAPCLDVCTCGGRRRGTGLGGAATRPGGGRRRHRCRRSLLPVPVTKAADRHDHTGYHALHCTSSPAIPLREKCLHCTQYAWHCCGMHVLNAAMITL